MGIRGSFALLLILRRACRYVLTSHPSDSVSYVKLGKRQAHKANTKRCNRRKVGMLLYDACLLHVLTFIEERCEYRNRLEPPSKSKSSIDWHNRNLRRGTELFDWMERLCAAKTG